MINVTHLNLMSLNTLGILLPIIAIIGSIFTFVYSIKFILHIFFGSYKPEALPKQAHESSILMLIYYHFNITSYSIRFIPKYINAIYYRAGICSS